MPRTARTVIADVPHHVTQRGNNRQDVFFSDQERLKDLEILKRESRRHELEIHAWCLMTNHIHIVGVPRHERALALTLGRTHFMYAQHVNRLHHRSGHLWQNRFYSCPVEDAGYPAVLRYVETNPVRAGLASDAWRYEWSSAAAHTGGADPIGLLNTTLWGHIATPADWKQYLAAAQDKDLDHLIRTRTHQCRPLGSDSFVSQLETLTGRNLQPPPRGRPRKEQ